VYISIKKIALLYWHQFLENDCLIYGFEQQLFSTYLLQRTFLLRKKKQRILTSEEAKLVSSSHSHFSIDSFELCWLALKIGFS
jgi:hypothetical protein